MPLEHAQPGFGPSALEGTSLCPGKPKALAALPPEQRDTSTQASIDGTRRHALMEYCATTGEDPMKAPGTIGEWVFSLADRQACDKIWPSVRDDPARTGGGLWMPEVKLEIGKWCGLQEGLVWGTSDLVSAIKDTLRVRDHKFGRTPHSPDNLQMNSYAVGAGAKLFDPKTGQLFPEFRQVRTVELVILQPRNPEPVRSVKYPLEVLLTWGKEVKNVVDRALDPHAPLVPGEKQCRWCAAAATCPARLSQVAKAAETMFSVVEEVKKQESDSAQTPSPIASVDKILGIVEDKLTQDLETLSPEDLGRILDQAPLVEGWFKEARALGKKKLEAGEAVDGWKLISGKRSRKWNHDQEETVASLKKMGLPVRDIYVSKLVTPNQAEGLEKITKSKKRAHQLGELWAWKEGGPVLAPESDPSPAYNSPETMFEPVTPEDRSAVFASDNLPDWA